MNLSKPVVNEINRLMNYKLTDLEISIIMEKDGIRISRDNMKSLRNARRKNWQRRKYNKNKSKK